MLRPMRRKLHDYAIVFPVFDRNPGHPPFLIPNSNQLDRASRDGFQRLLSDRLHGPGKKNMEMSRISDRYANRSPVRDRDAVYFADDNDRGYASCKRSRQGVSLNRYLFKCLTALPPRCCWPGCLQKRSAALSDSFGKVRNLSGRADRIRHLSFKDNHWRVSFFVLRFGTTYRFYVQVRRLPRQRSGS